MKNLVSFFSRSQGKWISQRTTYELSSKNVNSSQSEVTAQLKQSLSNSVVLLNWANISRQIIHNIVDQSNLHNNYRFNLRFTTKLDIDEILTSCTVSDQSLVSFKTRYGITTIDETYWFVTHNLRLSTTIIKNFNTCVAVSFCSEIKV
uniref:Chromophore lyase CpcS/CpeS n=1 Tax=Wildemania schizophylla TaxID=1134705 RepID=A0A126G2W6_WILSC|nr:hypothetical protein [Wildemania schizophylla]AKS28378.1 hypothetical protein [Wildemania schizophylla]